MKHEKFKSTFFDLKPTVLLSSLFIHGIWQRCKTGQMQQSDLWSEKNEFKVKEGVKSETNNCYSCMKVGSIHVSMNLCSSALKMCQFFDFKVS
jgi:hypothetical protein